MGVLRSSAVAQGVAVSPLNVLISSAGRRVALLRSFRAALSELGLNGAVIATDRSRLSAAFQDADRRFLMPDCTSQDFIPTMLELCDREQVGLVVPTIDTELQVLADNRARFRETGTVVAISSSEVITIGNDKALTHAFLEDARIPAVRQGGLHEVLADVDRWEFPLIVKPRFGSAGIDVQRVEGREQLAALARPDVVVQSLAPGDEHTLDVLVNNEGRIVSVVVRKRLEVRAGEVSKGVTVYDPELIGVAEQLVAALPGPYGALTVQMFLEPASRKISVIELNPRFGGGFPLSLHAGARFPRWLIEDLLGLPSTAAAKSWREGLVMLRWDDAVFVNSSVLDV